MFWAFPEIWNISAPDPSTLNALHLLWQHSAGMCSRECPDSKDWNTYSIHNWEKGMSRCPFLLPSDSWCVHVILISLLLGNNTQKQGSKRHRHHSECSISAKINHIGCLEKTSPRIFLAALPPPKKKCHMSFAFTFTTPWDTKSVWDSTTLTSPMAILGLSNRNPCKQCTSFQLLIWIN